MTRVVREVADWMVFVLHFGCGEDEMAWESEERCGTLLLFDTLLVYVTWSDTVVSKTLGRQMNTGEAHNQARNIIYYVTKHYGIVGYMAQIGTSRRNMTSSTVIQSSRSRLHLYSLL